MEKAVQDAIRLLFANDAFLPETDVAERAIAARLMCYLLPHFPEHHIDVEYNRHGLETKRINLPEQYDGARTGRIYPDVIVHQRGHDCENLLVIQIKKSTNRETRDYDRAVVEAMKQDFQYRRGLLIELPAGPGATGRNPALQWM
jgi:hypothetical protein